LPCIFVYVVYNSVQESQILDVKEKLRVDIQS